MKKKLLFLIIFIVLGVFIGAAINAFKYKDKNTVPSEGAYRTINEVSGVSFAINSSIVNKSTAVSEISDKINIDPNLMYIYKNGEDKYILFGLNSIVVAVEKGTSFNLEKEMTEEDIESDSVVGIWFEKNSNKIQQETESNSISLQVNGGLNISTETYTDYTGKLRILTDGETQWAIFCGVPGTEKFKNLDSNVQKSIDAIVNSLAFSDYVSPITEEVYAVTIGEDTSEVESEEATSEIESEETTSEIETEEISTETSEVESIIIEEESEESNKEAVVEVSPTPTTTPSPTPNSTTETSYIASIEENVKKDEPVYLTNQKVIENKKNSEAYSSDIYSMLSLKDNGIIMEYDISTAQVVTPIINVSRVYKGKTAIQMIKDYCKSTGYYEYFDAPVGCEWHVAEYSLLYKDCDSKPYINIKLRGMDGNNLVYQGISYSKRTYDMLNKAAWNGNYYGKCYCYYAVPIGVREYCLECGLGTVSYKENSRAAYYKISY